MGVNILAEIKENISKLAIEGFRESPAYKAVQTLKKGHFLQTLKEEILIPHRVRQIGDGVYAITEAVTSTCYLIVGEDKALLIDTGFGIKGLRETVEGITDKPLEVYVTHGSPWTVGGAAEFAKVYVAKKDIPEARFFNKFWLKRKLFDFDPGKYLAKLKDSDLVDGECTFEAVTADKTINLGGRKVIVKPVRATTDGCLIFKDSKTSYTFSGNASGPVVVLIPKKSAALYDYSRTLDSIIRMSSGSRNYSHYAPIPLKYSKTLEINQLIKAAVKLGNRTDKIIDVLATPDNRRIVIYFAARVKSKTLKLKWKDFWNGNDTFDSGDDEEQSETENQSENEEGKEKKKHLHAKSKEKQSK